jgi:hypothetical protein
VRLLEGKPGLTCEKCHQPMNRLCEALIHSHTAYARMGEHRTLNIQYCVGLHHFACHTDGMGLDKDPDGDVICHCEVAVGCAADHTRNHLYRTLGGATLLRIVSLNSK